MSIQILLVDAHAVVRKELRLLVEISKNMSVIGETVDAETALLLVIITPL
jgi:DNA-binding NarL/FixJ family response regulator